MEFVDIKIECLARTQMDHEAVRRWLDSMGAVNSPIDPVETISDGEQLIGLAGKRCYKSFEPFLNPNVTKVRKEWNGYFNNILKSGHGSVLEHTNFTYAFENVSRVFTAEMNRHRAGVAISEQSLRYVRFNNIPFWLPTSLQSKDSLWGNDGKINPDDYPSDTESDLEYKKAKTRYILRNTLVDIERQYMSLVKLWDFDNMTDFHQKKIVTSMLRRIIPLGVATGAIYTMNGRAVRHICTMRCDPAAEEEICYVFSRVAKDMVTKAPLLFQDFKQTEEGFWYPEFRKV